MTVEVAEVGGAAYWICGCGCWAAAAAAAAAATAADCCCCCWAAAAAAAARKPGCEAPSRSAVCHLNLGAVPNMPKGVWIIGFVVKPFIADWGKVSPPTESPPGAPGSPMPAIPAGRPGTPGMAAPCSPAA